MSPKYCSFGEAIQLFFQNYTNFNGRSTRSEYWWIVLFNFIVGFAIGILMNISDVFNYVNYLYELAILIPSIALSIRRLHDISKSGWNLLLGIIPIVGQILLIVYMCKPSDGSNEWGEPAV